MATREPIEIGEWYHCYSRGVDKRKVFQGRADYERFTLLMYLGNRTNSVHISNLKNRRLKQVLSDPNLAPETLLVEIGAYALMPNHFHLLLKEVVEGGIARFMQKIITGYTMYFNTKNERTGSLFSGTYKSNHVGDDRYLKKVASYIHLNPIELFEPRWKEGKADLARTKEWLTYPYSSAKVFFGGEEYEKKMLGTSLFNLFDDLPKWKDLVREAKEYYESSPFIKV